MRGWIVFPNGAIEERVLRWVDEDSVRCNKGTIHKKGEWALLLDTAKLLAEQAVEKTLKSLLIYDPAGLATAYRNALKDMRGEGKYAISRMSS